MKTNEARLIRCSLATVWIITGVISLGIYPIKDSLGLLQQVGLIGMPAKLALFSGAIIDIVLGLLTLVSPGRMLWYAQIGLILIYTLVITVRIPEYWLHPFGPILKNIPILTMLWLLVQSEEIER